MSPPHLLTNARPQYNEPSMSPKADSSEQPPQPAAANNSGKLVIISIVGVALVAAGASWWFRYHSTHRAAKFWGPEAAGLIRDAPEVTLYRKPMVPTDSLGTDLKEITATKAAFQKHVDDSAIDVSHAHGLIHLRNALLEDHSFIWPAKDNDWPNPASDIGYWWLNFHDPKTGGSTTIWFNQDCSQTARLFPRPNGESEGTAISTEPIAAGLREMFSEFSANSPQARSHTDKGEPTLSAANPSR